MLNNFKFIFFIIFFLFSFNYVSYGNDQFNFDVTEVEITENGNRFKGVKRGVITTDDGLIIDANTFDYNKINNILKANGDVKINDTKNGVIIYSDEVTYLKDEEKVFTKNGSEATNKNFIITADKFYYDKLSNILKANDDVKFNDTKKDIIIYTEDATYLINEEKVFTKNGSQATDNELIITADKFYYDRLSNILKANDDVKIDDTIKDILVYSDEITYFKGQNKVLTKGNTKAIIESKYDFTSSNVLLLRNEGKLSSPSKTIIISEKIKSYKLDKFIYFIDKKLVKGENVKVNSNINVEKGKTDHLYFKNGFFNLKDNTHKAGDTLLELRKDNFDEPENDPRLVGKSSSSTQNETFVNKGIFTSCKKRNGKCPPWSIKAEKITHDRVKRQLTYDNAFLRVYDVPVLYFPKFFHPDPTVDRQSGFLKPQLNSSDILGSSIFIPYFKVISESKDLTFKPTIFDSNIYMWQTEYRQENKDSTFIADIGLTKGYKSSLAGSERNSMSHIFAKFNKNLKLDKFISSRLNFSGQKVSNDTYLKIFDNNLMETANKPSDFNSLQSGIDLELDHEDYTFKTGLTVYENLQTTKNSDRFQFVFPYYNYTTNLLTEKNIGGSLGFGSGGNNRLINTNNLVTEINNSLTYKTYDHILSSGFKSNFGVHLHNSNKIASNDTKIKKSPQMEARTIFEIQSSFPLFKKEKYYISTIEPKLSFRLNPGDMSKFTNDQRKINADNVFNIDRLGIGEYEAGKSLTLGIEYKKEKIKDINKYFELKLATVLRDVEEDRIPTSSTINRRGSNLFGLATYKLSDNIELDYDFSIDNDLHTFEYNSIGATFDNEKLFTKINFIEETGTIGNANSFETEIGYNFNENNYLKFKTRRNRTISLTEYYDLVYEYKNDCLIAGFKYKKTYYQDRDHKPKEDLLLSITFFPLSTFEQEIDQNFYRGEDGIKNLFN